MSVAAINREKSKDQFPERIRNQKPIIDIAQRDLGRSIDSKLHNNSENLSKHQKTMTSSPNGKTQEKQKILKKEENSFTQKNANESKQYKMKRIENSSAYLPDLESEVNGNLSKKKAVLDKEINKIFNEKLPDIRLSIFNKRNSDDSFLSVKSNDKPKNEDSGRIKAHSQISMNKNTRNVNSK